MKKNLLQSVVAASSLVFLGACGDVSARFNNRMPEEGEALEDGDVMGGIVLGEDVVDVVFWTREEFLDVPFSVAEEAYNFEFPALTPQVELEIIYDATKNEDPLVTVELNGDHLLGTYNGYCETLYFFPPEAGELVNEESSLEDEICPEYR